MDVNMFMCKYLYLFILWVVSITKKYKIQKTTRKENKKLKLSNTIQMIKLTSGPLS